MTQYNISDVSQQNLNRELYRASQTGDLDYIKYLLTSPELEVHADFNSDSNRCFKYACQFGHLEVIKYMLNSSDVKSNINPREILNTGVMKAADNNQVAVLDYCRTEYITRFSPLEGRLIKDNLVILERACAFGFLEIVDYIFKNPKVDNYLLDEKNLTNLFDSCVCATHYDLVKYFIFELKLDKSDSINQLLDELSEHQKIEIERLFELRDINKSLNADLALNQNTTKKNKV